tara:strand:+ start:339 stop:743 length:405 start_codon:yes stop_codon:yes gene_type:complete
MIASESGEMVCFLCGSMVDKDDHEEGCIRLWELDVYEAMEYALCYRYPSLKYTEALKSTFTVPPRFQQPVQESIDSDEDEWEDVPHHEEEEEEESDEDIFVNVMGVPKGICDITEDDQQNMTDEEYSAFYRIVC